MGRSVGQLHWSVRHPIIQSNSHPFVDLISLSVLYSRNSIIQSITAGTSLCVLSLSMSVCFSHSYDQSWNILVNWAICLTSVINNQLRSQLCFRKCQSPSRSTYFNNLRIYLCEKIFYMKWNSAICYLKTSVLNQSFHFSLYWVSFEIMNCSLPLCRCYR